MHTAFFIHEIIDFIDYVFSKAHRPHDFATLLPKLYGEHGDAAQHHIVVREEGKIAATLLCYPVKLHAGGKTYMTMGVGSVSTHPRARGKGYLGDMMKLADARAKELGAAVAVLGGQRQRYEYYGFQHGGYQLRAQLVQGDEAYVLQETQRDVMRKVNAAYKNASETRPWLAGNYGTPKLAILSTPLAYLNIAGIFSPFTMEAHVDAKEADVMLAATAMHEAAHLRGFAREDEANYIAYAVCTESDDVYVRYSGTILALIYAGNALAGADMERYSDAVQTYSAGVRADLRAYNANWEPYQGKAAEVHDQMNDAYLKANHQTDGVKSYGRMVDLLIAQMEADKTEGKDSK